jgi:dihydrofolate synthase/folylpolyglutamate synthase
MTYAEAAAHLYALGPELPTSKFSADSSEPGPPRRKFDLAHMRRLLAELGNPERMFRSVLIAGTNGKGSTAATLASIFTAAGYRTGLYTSPHLVQVNERIQVSRGVAEEDHLAAGDHPGAPLGLALIEDAEFARLYTLVDTAGIKLVGAGELPFHPSFFERLTAVGFLYFARPGHRVDIAILEVGLGGRLDATNVVEPLVSVITDIALDHQEYLGNTITEIAREKAGILRAGGTLITLPQHPEANQAIGEIATALGVQGVNSANYLPPAVRNDPTGRSEAASALANRYVLNLEDSGEAGLLEVDSPLAGQHQQRNLALAIAAAITIRNQNGYKISNSAIEAGIRHTVWPGRLEQIGQTLLLDVAHNPAGAWTLRAALTSLPESRPRTLVFSCLKDKNLREMTRILFPLFDSSADGDPARHADHILVVPIDSARATPVEELVEAAKLLQVPALAAADVEDAWALARSVTPAEGLIVVTGSVYLVGAVRSLLSGPASAAAADPS